VTLSVHDRRFMRDRHHRAAAEPAGSDHRRDAAFAVDGPVMGLGFSLCIIDWPVCAVP
jgi:hypothetical protein